MTTAPTISLLPHGQAEGNRGERLRGRAAARSLLRRPWTGMMLARGRALVGQPLPAAASVAEEGRDVLRRREQNDGGE